MKILFIDDDPDDMILYEEAIRSVDSEALITQCMRAKEALCLLITKTSEPDLIILDYHMPAMDGLQFLNELRGQGRWKLLPVVVVSTKCPPSKEEEFHSLRALCFKKPSTFEGLQLLLQSILELFNQDKLSV